MTQDYDPEDLSQYPEQEWPDLRPKVAVHWYTCDCAETIGYVSKYCDNHHTAYARVPKSVLDQYRV